MNNNKSSRVEQCVIERSIISRFLDFARNDFVVWIFPALLTLLILRPILGNVWYPMHDTTHVARLYLMEQTIMGGQFPPIWAEGINNGFGYPLFHFYAPLFYYIALAIKQFAGSYILALKLTLGLFLMLGGIGVMAVAKKWGRGAMLLGATLFLASPYLAVDLYVRGAYSELVALCLLPWVFYAWQDLSTTRKQVVAGAVTALFLLSHNLIPILAFPLVAIWVIVQNYKTPKGLLLPTLLTILLSASLTLPLIFERNFVQADAIAKTSNYNLHFVAPWQLWNSTWGYGGSADGVEDGFSFKVGKLQLILALLGTLILTWKKQRNWLFGMFAIISLFMTTYAAIMVWQNIPTLALAQFPWRYLAVATSTLAIVGAASVLVIKNRIIRSLFILGSVAILLFLNLKYFTPQSTITADDSRFTDAKYLGTVTSIIPEYMPVWMKEVPKQSSQLFANYQGTTTIARAYYPNWEVWLDDKMVDTFASRSGLLEINNPQESTNISFRFGTTPLERASYALTIFGLGLSIYWWLKK